MPPKRASRIETQGCERVNASLARAGLHGPHKRAITLSMIKFSSIAATGCAALVLAAPLGAQTLPEAPLPPGDTPLEAEVWTPEEEAQAYLDRIAMIDDDGPLLNAVIAYNDDIWNDAEKASKGGGFLGGLTVLV